MQTFCPLEMGCVVQAMKRHVFQLHIGDNFQVSWFCWYKAIFQWKLSISPIFGSVFIWKSRWGRCPSPWKGGWDCMIFMAGPFQPKLFYGCMTLWFYEHANLWLFMCQIKTFFMVSCTHSCSHFVPHNLGKTQSFCISWGTMKNHVLNRCFTGSCGPMMIEKIL